MSYTQPLSTREQELMDLLTGDRPTPIGRRCTHPSYVARQLARQAIDDARGNAALDELMKECEEISEEVMTEAEVVTTSTIKVRPYPATSTKVDDPHVPVKLESPFTTIAKADASPASVSKVDVPAVAAKTKPHREEAAYCFPRVPVEPSGLLNLRAELKLINAEFKISKDYAAVRDRFCAVSIALNVEGLWAPQFRPQPRISPVGRKSPSDLKLHKDHLVIDAHWLWLKKYVMPFTSNYSGLFDSTRPFDFRLAAQYALEKWTSAYRAEEHFCFTSRVQWQLCTTKSVVYGERHRELLDGTRNGTKRTPAHISLLRLS